MRGRLERDTLPDPRQESDRRSVSRGGGGSDGGTGSDSPDGRRTLERETPVPENRRSNARQKLWSCRRSFELRPSELETMTEIGRFRMIDVEDLVEYRYRGDRTRAEQDLRNLVRQRLARRIRLVSRAGNRYQVVVLTRPGRRLLTRTPKLKSELGRQRLYSGFVKPAEALHDATLYRMYQIEAERIRQDGGRIQRVVLDYELKEEVFRPLSRLRQQGDSDQIREKQEEVARRYGLPIVRGRVAFPDLRIEYETRDGEREKRDLELATEHYRPGQLAEKRQAGFKIYFAGGVSRSSGSTVKDERELTAEILK